MGFARWSLRENEDERDDRQHERGGGGVPGQSQAAVRDWFVEEIADRCSERPGQNKGRPKQKRVRNGGEVVEERRDQEQPGEHPARAEVTQAARVREPIAEGGAEGL